MEFKLSDLRNEQVAPRAARRRRATITVDLPSDAALPEEQAVLGEGSRLVGEQVAHLAELLAQRGAPGLRRRVSLLPIHLQIPANKQAVDRVDDLEPVQGAHACINTHPSILAGISGGGKGKKQKSRRLT